MDELASEHRMEGGKNCRMFTGDFLTRMAEFVEMQSNLGRNMLRLILARGNPFKSNDTYQKCVLK